MEATKTLPVTCRAYFENSAAESTNAPPTIDGKSTTLDAAVAEAAHLIQAAKRPLLSSASLDVEGAREVLKLARACGGIVDHSDGDASACNTRILQNSGWVLTTLAEVRTRADFIIVIGNQILDRYPRVVERVLTGPRLFHENAEPEVVLIGPWQDRIPDDLQENLFEAVNVSAEEIPDCVQMLAAVANGHSPEHETGKALLRIVDKIKSSAYTALLWDTGDLQQPHADLTVETLAGLTKHFNKETRCVGLPLSGNSTTLNNVCLWQSGLPIRTDFGTTPPTYDPSQYATSDLLANKTSDLLIWTAALHPDPPPDCDIPLIAITRPDVVPAKPAAVHIPVGIPGIDHNGHIFRTDNVVMVPLKQLRQTELPSATEVLAGIRQQLPSNGAIQC